MMTHTPEVQAIIDAIDEWAPPDSDLSNMQSVAFRIVEARRALDPKPEAPKVNTMTYDSKKVEALLKAAKAHAANEQRSEGSKSTYAELIEAISTLAPKPEAPERVSVKFTAYSAEFAGFTKLGEIDVPVEYIRADLVPKLVKCGVSGWVPRDKIRAIKESSQLEFPGVEIAFVAQVEPPK